MHQDSADGNSRLPAVYVLTTTRDASDPDQVRFVALKSELRGVMHYEDGPIRCAEPVARGSKMASENFGLVDPLVRKKAIGRFGVGPILTSHWNRVATSLCKA